LLSLARHRVLARIEQERTGGLIDKAMRQVAGPLKPMA
jgi:hypothetical protein